MNRREFLETGAVLVGGMLLSPLPLTAAGGPAGSAATKDNLWYRRPLRILQTVLREPDARGYDAQAVVEYLKAAACNALVVNGGGIVDFFQNPLPLANPSPFLGDRDVLREISDACRAAGIRVIARVDFRGVEERQYRQHPDWFGVARDGGPMTLDYTRPKLYASCYSSYYRNEHAERFIAHLLRNYAIDGIWHNSVILAGVCYCPRCRDSYRATAGADLPDPAHAAPAELEGYMQWKVQAASRHVARMRRAVKAFGEEKAYAAEVFGNMFEAGGAIWSGIDLYTARDYFDFLVGVGFITENTETIHYDDLFQSATLVRMLKAMAPEKEVVVLYGDNGTSHRYIMDPPEETRIWLWEALSVGGRFWNCWFMGMDPEAAPDHRTALNSAPIYAFVRDHEDVLAHHVPVANVGVFYSRATRQYYRTPSSDGDVFGDAIKGVETVLLEAHIPYDFIPDDQLTAQRLAQYAVVILPNVRCLSSAEAALFREYVRGGGKLIATFATGLNDEHGARREVSELSDVFGARFTGKIADTRKDNYQAIAAPAHPLVGSDAKATTLLVNYNHTLLCTAADDATVVCRYVPTIVNQPPEKAWTETWTSPFATVVDHVFGQGRCVYFANQPDQGAYDFGHPDLRGLLERAVRYLAGDALLIAASTAPESVHIGVTRSRTKPSEYLVTLVNLTSSTGRPVRRVLPVEDVRVTLRLPGDVRSRVLRAAGECKVTAHDGHVEIACARLEDACVVHLTVA